MKNRLKKLWAGAVVLAKALPTYLAIAAAVIPVLASAVADVVPNGWEDDVVRWGLTAVGIVAAVTQVVKRVTPVLKHQQGILGPEVRTYAVSAPPKPDQQ